MEFLIRSGIWVAGCAVALLLASARSMGVDLPAALIAVTALGTVGIYDFDRWSASGSRRPWWILAVAGAVASSVGLRLPELAILAGVCALALLHSRLREIPWVKPLYIALAWLGVVVGLPWVVRGPGPVPLAALPIALAIVANVLACDAVDREAEAAQIDPRRVWWIARGIALAGVVTGLPSPLAIIPGAVLLAMARWPVTRWWAERGLDGALLLGGVLVFLID